MPGWFVGLTRAILTPFSVLEELNDPAVGRFWLFAARRSSGMEPNDVDCVLLTGRGFPKDRRAEAELRAGLPFLDLAIVRRKDFERLVHVVFASDRHDAPKGMVEVIL